MLEDMYLHVEISERKTEKKRKKHYMLYAGLEKSLLDTIYCVVQLFLYEI